LRLKECTKKSLSFYIAVTIYENAPDSHEYLIFTQFNFYIIIEAGKQKWQIFDNFFKTVELLCKTFYSSQMSHKNIK